MPEIIIKYKKPETLKILKGLAKYFDFTVGEIKKDAVDTTGVTIIPGDRTIVPDDLSDIFQNIDAKELRQKAWQRRK